MSVLVVLVLWYVLEQHHCVCICTCTYITMYTSFLTVSTTQSSAQDVALFVVKFDYEPLKMSPNPNPHHELILTAGRYVYIYGDMDEVHMYVCRCVNLFL